MDQRGYKLQGAHVVLIGGYEILFCYTQPEMLLPVKF